MTVISIGKMFLCCISNYDCPLHMYIAECCIVYIRFLCICGFALHCSCTVSQAPYIPYGRCILYFHIHCNYPLHCELCTVHHTFCASTSTITAHCIAPALPPIHRTSPIQGTFCTFTSPVTTHCMVLALPPTHRTSPIQGTFSTLYYQCKTLHTRHFHCPMQWECTAGVRYAKAYLKPIL